MGFGDTASEHTEGSANLAKDWLPRKCIPRLFPLLFELFRFRASSRSEGAECTELDRTDGSGKEQTEGDTTANDLSGRALLRSVERKLLFRPNLVGVRGGLKVAKHGIDAGAIGSWTDSIEEATDNRSSLSSHCSGGTMGTSEDDFRERGCGSGVLAL
jgi:hypothetical protein